MENISKELIEYYKSNEVQEFMNAPLGDPNMTELKARSNGNAGYRGKMTREEILKKTKYKFIEKNFDWLERTIEGLLNDFEGGITEKEETMHQFFVLIFDKLVAEIQELRDKLSSQLEPLVIKKNADGLLPCPFCGEYPKIGSLGGDNENWAIWCECQIPCAETGLSGETKEEIINAWNKRK